MERLRSWLERGFCTRMAATVRWTWLASAIGWAGCLSSWRWTVAVKCGDYVNVRGPAKDAVGLLHDDERHEGVAAVGTPTDTCLGLRGQVIDTTRPEPLPLR